MDDSGRAKVCAAVSSAAAIVMGWASVIIDSMSRALFAGIAGLAVMVALGFAVSRAMGGKGMKWWLASGGGIFILVWIVSWIAFHNI